MALAWEALEQHDRQTGEPLSPVLRFRADHPAVPSPEMAKDLSVRMGKSVSPEWVRKWLARGRAKFADLLLDEAAGSLRDDDPEALEVELIELGLLDFCRAALERRRESISHGPLR